MLEFSEIRSKLDNNVSAKVTHTASPSPTTSQANIRCFNHLQSQLNKSWKYELTDDTLMDLLSHTVIRSFENNANCPIPSLYDIAAPFFSIAPADMNPVTYIERLMQYLKCSRSAFVVALIYLQRIQKKYPQLAIVELNFHRLLVTSILIGAKTLDDRVFSNSHYARVGGIPSVQELNRLELLMMRMLDFELFVYREEYLIFVWLMSNKKIPSLRVGFKNQIGRRYAWNYAQLKSKSVDRRRWLEEIVNEISTVTIFAT